MELFYRHYGEGQALIILHGLFGVSDNWVTIGKRLAEKFSVYIPDLRNHGQSPHSEIFDYDAMVEDLDEFIDRHSLKTPVLIGHSMGGKVAMKYTLENPERIDRMIIVDMGPRKYDPRLIHQKMLGAMLSIDFGVTDSRTEIDKLLTRDVPETHIRQFILKNLYRPERSTLAWRPNLDAINNNLTEVFEGIENHSSFDGPVMFVAGGRSDYITEKDHARILELFPQAIINTIAGASHWVHSEEPEALCAMFSSFLGKNCSIQ